MTEKTFHGRSRAEIEGAIDAFIKFGDAYRPLTLIMPVSGATKYEYRGLQIREWHTPGNVRFDAAVDLL